ncbi:MAG: tRNA (adenosine(37)-N6)-dimethylallyltransferase MiaA [Bacteroidota bacterium]|nr:tRNA (adenosine(37)-N6)-dimethylallyltransferase MiaA [Bacteroidota bacterium]
MEQRVIIIAGPTCSGKTALSVLLAKALNSEVISADSRQVFKYLNVGTAKPASFEMREVKHYFIDEIEPDVSFNANVFEQKSFEIIKQLHSKEIIPIVAGGSGLYIRALVNGITESAIYSDEIRETLLKEKEEKGIDFLYKKLEKLDPVSASRMLPQNWKRVLRALEVFLFTGKPIWEHHLEYKRDCDVQFLQFALNWERAILYANIDKRVDQMMESGLVDEVKSILEMGYPASLNALNTVGYKEIIEYLEGKISLDYAVELIKRNTRRYAKKQMTWFRADERITWLNIESSKDLPALKNKIISQL